MFTQARNIALLAILILPLVSIAQYHYDSTAAKTNQKAPKQEHHIIGIGVKAGLNFANVTSASDINSSRQTGFNAGIFFSPPGKILGSYTGLAFSRQGYNFSTNQVNNKLMLNYLSLEQLMAINITKFVQIQLGARTAYLLNAKTDSSSGKLPYPDSTGMGSQYNSLLSYFNRLDYGVTGGVEVHPVLGLVIGARYYLSFANLYKQAFSSYSGGSSGSGGISINPKNNLIQVYAGWRF